MNEQDVKYQKVKERVEAIKGFYIHLTVYIVVNLMLFTINMVTSPGSLWFIWPLMGWGIGFAFHALSVFVFYPGVGTGFGADWEERKIKEIMEKE
jgi:hypothetical protein